MYKKVNRKENRMSRVKQYGDATGKVLIFLLLISFLLTAPTDPTETRSPQDNQEIGGDPADVREEQPNTFVFQNINLITMTDDQVLENQSVVIEDGLITGIGDAHTIPIPEGAILIPGQGKSPQSLQFEAVWLPFQKL